MDAAVAMKKADVPQITSFTSSSEQQITDNEHSFIENVSTMTQSSGGTTRMPPFDSRSPPNESESVASNLRRKPPRKAAVRNVNDQKNVRPPHVLVMRKSHFVGGINPFISKQVPLTQPYFQVSRELKTECTLRTSEKFSSSDVDQCVENNQDPSLKSTSFSKDAPNLTKCQPEAGDEIRPQHIIKPSYADLEPHSKKSDLAEVPRKYNFERKLKTNSGVPKGIRMTTVKNFFHYNIPSMERPAFEMSELGLKLRSSIQSNFLFNELGLWSHRCSEAPSQDPSLSIRTIDEILKDHGISENTDDTISKEENAVASEEQAYCQAEDSNISQNNEAVSSYLDTITTEKKDEYASANSSEEMNLSARSTHDDSANDSKVSQLTKAADTELIASSKVEYKSNLSQNNETIKYGQTESDALRKYGSSVDYHTSSASGGRQSHRQKSSYGRYDYGKVSPFSGNTSSGSALTSQNVGSTNFESNMATTLKIKSEGSQVDMTIPNTSIFMDPGYTYKNVTSESLEHSIFSERQRLRRLNNLITATSMSTPKTPTLKSPTIKFMSPQQDLQKYSAMKQVAKVFSTPTFPSSSQGAKLANRRSWAGSGRPDSQIHLHTSSNVAGQWMQGVSSINRYGSSMDFQSPYKPFHSARHYNTQYNNSTYQSHVVGTFSNQTNINTDHLKIRSTIKPDFQLNNTKNCISRLNKQSSHINSKSPLDYTLPLPIYDISRSYTASNPKPSYRTRTMTEKNNRYTNINDSKSVNCLITGLQFVKDLDRRFSNPLVVKNANMSLKYSAYTPYTPIGAMKNETFHNIAKQLFDNKKPLNTGKANFSRTESPGRNFVSQQQRGSHHPSLPVGRSPLDKRFPSAKEFDTGKPNLHDKKKPEQKQ